MKLKVLLLSALFTILAILTSSCKDEASDLSQTSVFTESEYVRYQIDSLNISLFPDQFDPTRGWKQWFKKIAAIARNSFGMYQGETRNVKIVCDKSIVGVFIDRFGYDIDIIEKGNEARVTIELEVSPQFFGWLSGLGDKAHIEGPEDVRNEYKD